MRQRRIHGSLRRERGVSRRPGKPPGRSGRHRIRFAARQRAALPRPVRQPRDPDRARADNGAADHARRGGARSRHLRQVAPAAVKPLTAKARESRLADIFGPRGAASPSASPILLEAMPNFVLMRSKHASRIIVSEVPPLPPRTTCSRILRQNLTLTQVNVGHPNRHYSWRTTWSGATEGAAELAIWTLAPVRRRLACGAARHFGRQRNVRLGDECP